MEKTTRKHVVIASVLSGVVLLGFASSFFRFSKTASSPAEWMSQVGDDVALSALSIPGSHDSGALYSVADLSGKCQDASIAEQLSYGVRFFDVRLKNESNSLNVYHGFINENLSFADLLKPMYSFLKDHPREGLLLSAKLEQKDHGSSKSFETVLQETIAANPTFWILDRGLPANLGAIRGKIVLISRYANNTIGIDASPEDWKDPSSSEVANTFTINRAARLRIQDHYKLSNNQVKWDEMVALLTEASSANDPKTLYLNFFSGYRVSLFPPSYSVTTAKVINPRILHGELPEAHKGVLIVDFVTSALVSQLLKGNPS